MSRYYDTQNIHGVYVITSIVTLASEVPRDFLQDLYTMRDLFI